MHRIALIAASASLVLACAGDSTERGSAGDAGRRDASLDAGGVGDASASSVDGAAGQSDAAAERDSGSLDASRFDTSGPDAGVDAGSSGADAASDPHLVVKHVFDLLDKTDASGLQRVYGANGEDGTLGLPVASGADVDGDGNIDFARGAFLATGVTGDASGIVYLILGDGTIGDDINLDVPQPNVIRFLGTARREASGSEVWMDDVTGDGIGDLLIARQNFRAANPDRRGAGALSIVVGGAQLRSWLEQGQVDAGTGWIDVDLGAPPASVSIFTLVGAQEFGRFGIWMRTGDVTGDGIADIVVGADQESDQNDSRHGAVYVIRGGVHLASTQMVDLQDFGSTSLVGNLARLRPEAGSTDFHFGATVQVGDLDRNGRAEVLGSAALVRAGASLIPDGAGAGSVAATGGAERGRVYIAWDDNFADNPWPAGFEFTTDAAPGTVTQLRGGQVDERANRAFGEELLAGADYDANGRPDLFVGDMSGGLLSRASAGIGYVIFDADQLRGMPEVVVGGSDPGVRVTTILGRIPGAITGDTAVDGDFDGDGVTDLLLIAPNDNADARLQAGVAYVLWGNTSGYPEFIDLANRPWQVEVQITEIFGAAGGRGIDSGDMLGYSADVADVDGDGQDDFILNEMAGNGLAAGALDVGNYVVLSGALVASGRADCNGEDTGATFDRCGVCGGPDQGEQPVQGCVSFSESVQPMLGLHCPQCHGASGGLSVSSHQLLMSGTSDHGPVILPGRADESRLIRALEAARDQDAGVVPMPPDYALDAQDIQVLRTWIDEGARDN